MVLFWRRKETGVFKYKEKFIEAEEYIRGLGHIVLNPSFLPEGLSDYYEINKAMIDQCDAIYVLLNYENSTGTKKEIEYAESTGKQVIYQNSTEARDQNGNSWSWVNRPLGYSDYPIGYGNYWEYPWRRCW